MTSEKKEVNDKGTDGGRKISLQAADKILSVLGVQYTLGGEKDGCKSDYCDIGRPGTRTSDQHVCAAGPFGR